MTNILTAEQVYDLAGISVDSALIARAQLVISTTAGVVLSDAPTFAALRLRDQRCLTTAVVWQVVYLDQHPEAFGGGDQPANVLSAAANGASITYSADVDAQVAPLALRELSLLSWRSQPVTVRTLRPYARATVDRTWITTTEAEPALPYVNRGAQPDPWSPL